MKLAMFFENEQINKFSLFIDAILSHKGEAKGVILNWDENIVQVIYYYLEEKQEQKIDNYINYESDTIPYFTFAYQFITGKTVSFYTIKTIEKQDDSQQIISIRINIDEFVRFADFFKKEAIKYGNCFIKAKSVLNVSNNKNENIFYMMCDPNVALRQMSVKIKTPKNIYQMQTPTGLPEYTLTVKYSNFSVLKEISEKWQSKLLNSTKSVESSFFIIVPILKGEADNLHVRYIFDKKSLFDYEHRYGAFTIGKKFEKCFYRVSIHQFIQILKYYKESNYNNECELNFLGDQIIFNCSTSGVTREEKEKEDICYSFYSFRIMVKALKSEEEAYEILENNYDDIY